jgi:nicotinate (nicotinamide) nucleotide adenylyltransferase
MKTTEIAKTPKIGVYFGSFDPIHKNHINLCINLINKGFSKIYIVPNQDNPIKPYTVLVDHRLTMIKKAIEDSKMSNLITIYKLQSSNDSWHDRSLTCDQIKSNHLDCSLYQIIGQDSYENALTRCKPPNGIYQLSNRFLLVYPRKGFSPDIKIPKQINNFVQIVDDYIEKFECSSTIIRDLISNHVHFDDLKQFIEQSVYQYIQKNTLYHRHPRRHCSQIIAILGPPGSGKSSLCQQLIKLYPQYKQISTGDIYRSDQKMLTDDYLKVEQEKKKGSIQYMDALHHFIICKLKQLIDLKQYYLIDGLKATDLFGFEQKIAPIDHIIILNCHYSLAEHRLINRQKTQNRSDDQKETIKKRLSNYYNFMWIQKEIIKSYQGTGRVVTNINCQKPITHLLKHPIWNVLLKMNDCSQLI